LKIEETAAYDMAHGTNEHNIFLFLVLYNFNSSRGVMQGSGLIVGPLEIS